MTPAKYFTPAEKEAIVDAIREAEKNTSGEIRVHIENHAKKATLDRAAQVFADLKIHKTALRNGVISRKGMPAGGCAKPSLPSANN